MMFLPTVAIVVRFLMPSTIRSISSGLGRAASQPPYSSTASMIFRPKMISRTFLLRSATSVATAAPCMSGWMMFFSSTRMLVVAVKPFGHIDPAARTARFTMTNRATTSRRELNDSLMRAFVTCSGCICIVFASVIAFLRVSDRSEQSFGDRDHVPRLEQHVGFKPPLLEYVAELDIERFGLALRLAIEGRAVRRGEIVDAPRLEHCVEHGHPLPVRHRARAAHRSRH